MRFDEVLSDYECTCKQALYPRTRASNYRKRALNFRRISAKEPYVFGKGCYYAC